MSTDDPFSLPDSERTVILPTPGARAAAPPPPATDEGTPATPTGLNPLVAAANPLLDVVPQLRASARHPDPAGLRDALTLAIRNFENAARAAGVRPEHVVAARYALCTLLDETVAGTPWGGSGAWARNSLLVLFHNEAWGGEKFFLLLRRLAESPAANRDLLELMYVCLALGFRGRYQLQPNGTAELDTLRERLADLLRRQRGDYEPALSARWQGARTAHAGLFHALPLWCALGGLALLAALAFWRFSYLLGEQSDPVYAAVQALRVGTLPPPAPAPAAQPRLAVLLGGDIAAGMVDVRDEADRSVVAIRGDGLFAPGSASVATEYLPTLEHVARALDTLPGTVRVLGHTDNVPIRTPRFPSNWHLSQARAQAVAALLAQRSRNPLRFQAEGRADAEPLVPNTSLEARARNRRIELVLASPAGAQGPR
jgi:type VI secretion system protein ImpK